MAQITQPQSATLEVLAGYIERVTYHNAENGFCVLRAKARGHRDVVTVIGHAATISAGEWITARGEWVTDTMHDGSAQEARRRDQALGNQRHPGTFVRQDFVSPFSLERAFLLFAPSRVRSLWPAFGF
jgi:hypothetical protein